MAGARHGKCELTRHAWQGNGIGTEWARRGLCELAFIVLKFNSFSLIQIFEKRENMVSEQEKAAHKRRNEVDLSAG
jgi:hypothetical protein